MGNDPEFVDAHARLFQDAIAKEHLTDVDATLLAAAHPRLAALVGADVSDVSDVSECRSLTLLTLDRHDARVSPV